MKSAGTTLHSMCHIALVAYKQLASIEEVLSLQESDMTIRDTGERCQYR